jgi:perosamine synthetase
VDAEPRIRLARPFTDEAEVDGVRGVLATGTLTQGPKVAEFEALIAERLGVPHAFAVTSATTALHLSLVALGIGPGDEVLVPDFTFPATANVVVQQGAIPVLVEIDLETFGVNAADLERKVSARTRAVMPVHAFGLSADMGPVMEIADRHGLAVVEDAACALGATYRGRPCGSIGTLGCFSFHPRKSITTGEGGMIITSDDALAARISLLRSHGGIREHGRFTFEAAGFNYRLSDILAAVGVAQVAKLDQLLAARRRAAGWYDRALAGAPGLRLPADAEWGEHTYQSYVVLLDAAVDRDSVIEELRREGIESTLGTYALHAQPYFSRSLHMRPGDLPNSFQAFSSSVALPLHAGLGRADVDYVAERLRAAVTGGAQR